jgi:alpha-amylase
MVERSAGTASGAREEREVIPGPKVCFGFEVHQPFRLDAAYRHGPGTRGSAPEEVYFSPENRRILRRVSDRCYIPATTVILDRLDEGFRCAFSLSGTVVEQLERWAPDAYDRFEAVARHQHCELVCQTYHHSLASLFADPGAFADQVRRHRTLISERFGQRPQVLENTEFLFSTRIAAIAGELGFSAVYAEGAERMLAGRCPNHVYRCAGMPVLLRNCPLSDDIAFRFANPGWDRYPLTAPVYASWLAGSPGDCIHVFLDYETFGEHLSSECGILAFLDALPGACADAGVRPVLPSEAAGFPAAGEIAFDGTVSWADLEKDTTAWLGNRLQVSAFRSMQALGAAGPDPDLWGRLQTSDHLYYIASKDGSCGEVHRHFCPQEAHDAFETYMRVIADYYARCAAGNGARKRVWALRPVPPEQAFHFTDDGRYAGRSAHSIGELLEVLPEIPAHVVAAHQGRGDFSRWIRDLLGDDRLADEIGECRDPAGLAACLRSWSDQLWDG